MKPSAAQLNKGKTALYKGFSIYKINKEYRARAYANPQFDNTNLKELIKDINQYLKSLNK